MSSIDKLKKILSKSTSVNGDVKIAKELVELDERLEEVENLVKEKEKITIKVIEELKGENGKDGYTPRKYIDYFDGERGEDGYTPIKGKDYFDGKNGRDGIDADYDIILEQILKEVPKYELKGEEVVDSINALPIEKEYQIDASHIKNLPQFQNVNGGGWRNLYQLHDVLLNEDLASGDILTYNGTSWVNSAFDDNGILSLNGLTGATQTFAVGTAGTDFDISSVGTTHTFNLPTASALNRGALSSADWSTFNAKQNAITGTDTQVLFFDGANNPAGDANFTYDKLTGIATLVGLVTPNIYTVDATTPDSLQINVGNATAGNANGGSLVNVTGNGFGAGNGGDVSYESGSGGDTGNGGLVSFTGGNGGATSGNGGNIAFTGGNAQAGNSDGGSVIFLPGIKAGAGTDGSIKFRDAVSMFDVVFDTSTITGNQNVAFQDASGTLAFLSDLSAYEPVITAGTVNDYWRGDKTFRTLDTSVVPENTNLYFTEQRVLDTLLTGLVVTGGAIVDTDNVLEAFGKAQNQINGLIGGVFYQGTWDALTNSPTLASGVGTQGHYYVVSVAGSTNLDGITTWSLGDWAIFNGTAWEKVDNTDAVISVNSATGAVSLTGTTNRITVTGTAWDIAATYVGQTSITTLGTITTGVWNGTAIANANLANSAITIGSTAISLGASSTTLAGLTSVTSTTFIGALSGNASTATALATARTIGTLTGDGTTAGSSFDGTGNNTNALTLATVNANVGTFGSATQSVQFTVNGKGLITAAANVTVTPAVGSITGLGTGVGTALAVAVGSAGAFVVNGGALGTPSSGTVTNLTGTASININGTVGSTTPTTGVFTTATVNTGLMPGINDGAYLGQAGTAFSDLFLAEGGVINWDSGDMTLTQVGNMLTIAGGDLTTPNITVSAMTAGSIYFAGTGGLLSQDNAELFWNNSTNMMGIGNADPQRKLHITSSSATSVTVLALDNPNTTDANATVQSFRTTTTGVGATAFTEMGAIRFTNRTHNHATRAADFSIFTALSGTLTEVVTIELGRFGIRQTAPTAVLHLKAGAATASGAPFKFTSGTNLTTAEAGAMEYDGTLLHFTPTGTVRKNIPTLTVGRLAAQTSAKTLATHTVGAADASYEVSANILVTTATSHNFTVTVAYTDEGNTARTATLNFSLVAGGALTTAIRDTSGAVPYMGFPLHIRCKASTTITIATVGTFTTVTYNGEGKIELLATA